MLALRGRSRLDTRSSHTKDLRNGTCYSLLSIQRNSMEVEHAVLPDGQPRTVAFTVLAQLFGPEGRGEDAWALGQYERL